MKKTYILIPFFVLLFSTTFLIFNDDFYRTYSSDYENNQDIIDNLVNYFEGKELNIEHYSEEEIIHLQDVRSLTYGLVVLITLLALVIILGLYWENISVIKENLIKGGIGGFILVAVTSLILLNFSSNFITFHKIFFRNEYWLLPPDSTLITLFPHQFFVTAVSQILLYSLIFSLLILVIGVYIPGVKKNGRKT